MKPLQQEETTSHKSQEESQNRRQEALKGVTETIISLQPEIEDIAKKLKIPKAFEFQLDIPVSYGSPNQEYSKIQVLELSILCHQPPRLEIINEKDKKTRTYTAASPQEASNLVRTHVTRKLDLVDQIYRGKTKKMSKKEVVNSHSKHS